MGLKTGDSRNVFHRDTRRQTGRSPLFHLFTLSLSSSRASTESPGQS